jgi:hypothetical protein
LGEEFMPMEDTLACEQRVYFSDGKHLGTAAEANFGLESKNKMIMSKHDKKKKLLH